MNTAADATLSERLEQTERWFVRRGVPHVIDDYRATTDVLTRAVPVLVLVFLAELFGTFGDRFTGWAQFGVVAAGAGLGLGAVAAVNRLRGRRPLQLPDRVGLVEVAIFVFLPPLLPVLLSAATWRYGVALAAANLVILGLTFVTVSFGLVPMARWSAAYALRQIALIGRLVGRLLPLLLLFSAFLFINAELWQVAHAMPPVFYGLCIATLTAIGLVSLVFRIPAELRGLATFDDWPSVMVHLHASSSPLQDVVQPTTGTPARVPALERVDLANMGLLMLVAQAARVVLVGAVVGLFYVGFGLMAIHSATLTQWLGTEELNVLARLRVLGHDLELTPELLAVSGFIAALSALQFAVSSVTDTAYREHFYDDLASELRSVLATRVLYLHLKRLDQLD